jgi:hypothetical protein
MPKRPAAPPVRVVSAEHSEDPLTKPADCVDYDPADPLASPGIEERLAAEHQAKLRAQLTDLAELIANARAVRDTGFLADAQKRIATLRSTLGL